MRRWRSLRGTATKRFQMIFPRPDTKRSTNGNHPRHQIQCGAPSNLLRPHSINWPTTSFVGACIFPFFSFFNFFNIFIYFLDFFFCRIRLRPDPDSEPREDLIQVFIQSISFLLFFLYLNTQIFGGRRKKGNF